MTEQKQRFQLTPGRKYVLVDRVGLEKEVAYIHGPNEDDLHIFTAGWSNAPGELSLYAIRDCRILKVVNNLVISRRNAVVSSWFLYKYCNKHCEDYQKALEIGRKTKLID